MVEWTGVETPGASENSGIVVSRRWRPQRAAPARRCEERTLDTDHVLEERGAQFVSGLYGNLSYLRYSRDIDMRTEFNYCFSPLLSPYLLAGLVSILLVV